MTELLSDILNFMKRQNKLISNLGSKVEDTSVHYTCIREKVRQQLEADKKHDEMERLQIIEKYGVTLKMKCEFCKKEFSNLLNLNKHVKTHRKKILYKCKRCRRLFPTIEILKSHIVSHVKDQSIVKGIQQRWSNSMEKTRPTVDPIKQTKTSPIKEDVTNPVQENALNSNQRKPANPVVITPMKASFATSALQQESTDAKQNLADKINVVKEGNETQMEDSEILLTLCTSTDKVDGLDNTTKEDKLSPHSKIIESVKTYCCKICFTGYSKLSYLNRHNALKHNGWKYNCKKKSKLQLDHHNKWHKKASTSSCLICQNICTSTADLQNHMDVVHKKYVCLNTKCNLEFEDALKLNEHISVHKSKTILHCKLCTKSFEDRKNLKQHIANVHDIGSMHSCDYPDCSKVFGNDAALSEHMTIQHGVKRQLFKCEICKKSFKSKKTYEYHQESHKRINSGLFSCNTCAKTYLNLTQLLIHQKMSHNVDGKIIGERRTIGSKRYVCNKPTCMKSFSYSTSLRRHLLTHNNNKTY